MPRRGLCICDVSQHGKWAKHKCAQEVQTHALPITAFLTRNMSEPEPVTKAQLKMSRDKNNVALLEIVTENRKALDNSTACAEEGAEECKALCVQHISCGCKRPP